MTYTIKLPVFEGPFDLLLHLVRVNEMDIQDIRIAEITRQYLEYIEMMRELDLELAGEFLVMAATLIRIKARMLLPARPESEEQEEEIDEILSARELVRQLVEYRRFKEAASELRRREEHTARLIFRHNLPVKIVLEEQEELSVDIALLYKAFSRVLRFVDSPTYNPNMQEKFSVEDKINYLQDLVVAKSTVDLDEVFRRCFNRDEVIVTFLAVLELCRMKRLLIEQEGAFEKIIVTAGDGQLEYESES